MANIVPNRQPSVPATAIGQDPPRNRSGRILRKRVKTGCLTCRRRRIKCGEQKPSCYNCIKSKRECDYNARLEFKNLAAIGEAVSSEYGHSFGTTILNTGQVPASYHQHYNTYPPPTAPASLLTPQTPSYPQQYPQGPTTPFTPSQPSLPQQAFTFEATTAYPSPANVTPSFPVFQPAGRSEDLLGGTSTYSTFPRPSVVAPGYDRSASLPQWQTQVATPSATGSEPPTAHPWSQDRAIVETPAVYPPNIATVPGSQDLPNKRRNVRDEAYIPTPSSTGTFNFNAYPSVRPNAPTFGRPDHNTILELAAVEMEDDEYFDVLPEEEEAFPTSVGIGSYALPSITSFSNGILPAFPDTVGLYNEAQAANPLKNQATQMIFRNFIWHTAPALSIFERPSTGTTPLAPPPGAYGPPNSCWMDALPKLALHDPGLLHSMLAQSSFEVAKSQGASTTPSGKHYAWSLRRVHRALDSPRKRHYLTTLAATLLLGFYEILTADHLKWSTHLCGARGLIMESNYKGMTNEVRRRLRLNETNGEYARESTALSGFHEPDQDLIETLMGFKVMTSPETNQPEHFAYVDSKYYSVQQDLFWWFCKQDAYHSIISGNDLLLPLDRWADCPPRGEIGDKNAVYASHDYLMLLLGRIASFAANDRPRKIKIEKMRYATTQAGPQQPSPVTPQARSPEFYGMAPTSGPPQLPRAYGTEKIQSVRNDKYLNSSPSRLQSATQKAHQDWNELHAACDVFESRLGADFAPLTPAEVQPFPTPFGESCQYLSYEIATLWLVYYMTVIFLIRAHPSKPPASYVSVGVSARETTWYANEIGRVAAGINPPGVQSPKHFKFLGAYTGSVVPLFFAGVQYQAAPQRFWVVQRLHEIARTCGWTTSETCANGCETAWLRAAQLGHGAPWQRLNQDFLSPDQRLSLRYLHVRDGEPIDPLDRRLLPYQPNSRLLWGFGVLGTPEDMGIISSVESDD